jgi:hypothetical protein
MSDATVTQMSMYRRLGVLGVGPAATMAISVGLVTISILEAASASPDEWFPGMGWLIAGMLVGLVGVAFALGGLVTALAILAVRHWRAGYAPGVTVELRMVAAANACVLAVVAAVIALVVVVSA